MRCRTHSVRFFKILKFFSKIPWHASRGVVKYRQLNTVSLRQDKKTMPAEMIIWPIIISWYLCADTHKHPPESRHRHCIWNYIIFSWYFQEVYNISSNKLSLNKNVKVVGFRVNFRLILFENRADVFFVRTSVRCFLIKLKDVDL